MPQLPLLSLHVSAVCLFQVITKWLGTDAWSSDFGLVQVGKSAGVIYSALEWLERQQVVSVMPLLRTIGPISSSMTACSPSFAC